MCENSTEVIPCGRVIGRQRNVLFCIADTENDKKMPKIF